RQGVLRSVKDGNYVGTRPPYGYQKIKTDDGRVSLSPDPEQSKIVKLIFEWYTSDDPNERMGSRNIAKRLNKLGIPRYYGGEWSSDVILQIIRNPVYIGKIAYGKVERIKSSDPTKGVDARIRPEGEFIIVDGRHKGIISEDLFNKAQEIRMKKRHPRWKPSTSLQNPLAGLIECGYCGRSMIMKRSSRNPNLRHIACDNGGKGGSCNKSARLEHVEGRILFALMDWLAQYKLQFDPQDQIRQNSKVEVYQLTIKHLQQEIKSLTGQKERLFDFLERGIYDEETFLSRSKTIADRLENARTQLEEANEDREDEYSKPKAQVNSVACSDEIFGN